MTAALDSMQQTLADLLRRSPPLQAAAHALLAAGAPAVYAALAAAATGYLVLVRTQRFRRVRNLERALGYAGLDRAAVYAKMSAADAFRINVDIAQLEFPAMYTTSLQFALFRVRGAPPRARSADGARRRTRCRASRRCWRARRSWAARRPRAAATRTRSCC